MEIYTERDSKIPWTQSDLLQYSGFRCGIFLTNVFYGNLLSTSCLFFSYSGKS